MSHAQAHREGEGVAGASAPGPGVLRGPRGPPQKIYAGVKRGESEQAVMGRLKLQKATVNMNCMGGYSQPQAFIVRF